MRIIGVVALILLLIPIGAAVYLHTTEENFLLFDIAAVLSLLVIVFVYKYVRSPIALDIIDPALASKYKNISNIFAGALIFAFLPAILALIVIIPEAIFFWYFNGFRSRRGSFLVGVFAFHHPSWCDCRSCIRHHVGAHSKEKQIVGISFQ